MFWVKVPCKKEWGNGITCTSNDYPCKSWEAALLKAVELAKATNQNVTISVFSPSTTLIATMKGMC